jgi:large subunit ribosomal protein L32
LTRPNPTFYSDPFTLDTRVFFTKHAHLQTLPPMANPKRKQSKRRSANRRAANAFKAPEFAKDPTDGSAFRPHRVNPKNGMYRGRQVLNVEV